MKSAIILALTSSTLAVPFGGVIDAMFGTIYEARDIPHPDHMPSFHPIGTGSGIGFPVPTMTGIQPTGTGGMHGRPHGPGHHHMSKVLAIDYQLAPTAVAKFKEVEKRQASSAALPSFTLLDPNYSVPSVTSSEATDLPLPTESSEAPIPTSTDSSAFSDPTEYPSLPTATDEPTFPFPTATGSLGSPLPTGGFPMPTGGFPLPTGGFPGTGLPSLPTTLATLTRGPQPTAMPEMPGYPNEEDGEDDGQSWLDWLKGIFSGGKSEMGN